MIPKGSTVVVIGTKKGLFLAHSRDRRRWKLEGPSFAGLPVYDAKLDPRDGKTLWAGLMSEHFGPAIRRSRDAGKTWTDPKVAPRYPKKSGLSVEKIWQVTPGQAPGEVWAGVEPAGLFRSADDGKTWESIAGINDWRGREKWMPGGGGLCLHTILPYPNDGRRMLAAASAVGVLGARDWSKSWRLMNGGVRNEMMPGGGLQEGQAGSCAHKLVRDPRDPDLVYMQNHWGVYRRRRGDDAWTEISKGLPSRFGFPMAAHPHDRGTVYTLPLEADMNRVTIGGAAAVYRTQDGGKRWQRLSKGLPQKEAWLTVLREGMTTDREDPAGVYFGTTSGQLYASRDEGGSWTRIADGLPPIMSVTAGAWGPS